MHDFDVILGIDWLSRYHATMDYFNKTISFKLEERPTGILFEGTSNSQTKVISSLKAHGLMTNDCKGYVAFITEIELITDDKQSEGVEIPVVF